MMKQSRTLKLDLITDTPYVMIILRYSYSLHLLYCLLVVARKMETNY